MIGGSATELRRRNRDLVLRAIASERSMSRSLIARQTGLTGAAISRITRELIDAGLVKEGESIETKGQVGRRNIELELDEQGAFILAIALTANVKSVSIANSRGKIIAENVLQELPQGPPEQVVADICAAAKALIASTPIDVSRLVGCGVSVAGVTDPQSGALKVSEPLGWSNVPLGALFSEALELPVRVERRPVALLTAELWRGGARGLNNVVLINNGLWLGGCVVADGRVLEGPANTIGQIAHLSIGGDDTPCSCGRRGCLDVTASGISILKKLEAIKIPGAPARQDRGSRLRSLARYTRDDLPDVQMAFRHAGQNMGRAVDGMIALLNPELILLAGETSRHPAYLDGVRDTLAALRPEEANWPVEVSELRTDQSAVWIGLDAFVFSQSLNIQQLMAA